MKEKFNKYFVLVFYGHFSFEDIKIMSEWEIDNLYEEIIKYNNTL
jgi:hypothetical protein